MYESEKLKNNVYSILKSDVKYRIYFEDWDNVIDFSTLISEFKEKLDKEILFFVLYSPKGNIIFSSSGFKSSKRSDGFLSALKGDIKYKIEKTEKTEHAYLFNKMGQIKYVQEVYIPISLNGSLNGVLEIYKPFDNMYKEISKVRYKATVITIIGLLIYVAVLYFIIKNIDLREQKLLGKMKNMEKLSTLGEFASKMAHEIGTPLNVIKGTMEIMSEACNCEAAKERIDIVDRQINKINLIIRNYLYATRRPEPNIRKVELKSNVEQIVNELSMIVDENIKFEMDLFEVYVNVDTIFLEQVIINIIKNSIDAIGINEGIIKISFSMEEKSLIIKISDNGPGIPEEIKDKIFDPFFSTKKSGKGTGLGLAVCKELMESMGGILRFNSKPGETVFELGVPC